MDYLEEARKNFLRKEENLSPYATKSEDAIRLVQEKEDMRSPFFHDIDRILHDLSYTRYQDKTQVFTNCENDHISKRMTHVQLVSKIARTIGRALNLNEDLIEAIALAHDIGHTPLGHAGEAMLNEICMEELGCSFAHNIEGVRYYMDIAKNGEGLNLSLQVLDGIMTHNGEMLSEKYEPCSKTKEEFLREYETSYFTLKETKKYHPMTLEGCVVRLSDIIGYIGRDIEDAIMIGRLKREDLPKEIINVLGDNNRDIINTLILDIIKNSMNKPYIKLSKEVYNALFQLKKFNYDKIYQYAITKEEYDTYLKGMKKLYYNYLEAIEKEEKESIIYQVFLKDQCMEYLENTSNKRKVIDFLAGMTDAYFLNQLKKIA